MIAALLALLAVAILALALLVLLVLAREDWLINSPRLYRARYRVRNWRAAYRAWMQGSTVLIPRDQRLVPRVIDGLKRLDEAAGRAVARTRFGRWLGLALPIGAGGFLMATSELHAVLWKKPAGHVLPAEFDAWSEDEQQGWRERYFIRIDLGLLSKRVITTAGANYIRDSFAAHAGSADVQNMKYHDSGTGTTAEAVGDTDLVTPAGPTTRATGSQANGTAKRYDTVGTISYSGTLAITEHGVFNQATRGAGSVLLDRSVFSAVNVASGDSIQFTYQLTIPDGG